MGDDGLGELIRRLIANVEEIPAINSAGLKNTMHPDALILSIHNHLGNIHQLIDSSLTAVNGAEQYLALKDAQKGLKDLTDNLQQAGMTGIISRGEEQNLTSNVQVLIDKISDTVDTDYS